MLGRKSKDLMNRRAQLMLRLASQVQLDEDDIVNATMGGGDVNKTNYLYQRIYTIDEEIIQTLNPENFDTDDSSGTDEDIPKPEEQQFDETAMRGTNQSFTLKQPTPSETSAALK